MGLTWNVDFIRSIPGMLMAGQIVSFKTFFSINFLSIFNQSRNVILFKLNRNGTLMVRKLKREIFVLNKNEIWGWQTGLKCFVFNFVLIK